MLKQNAKLMFISNYCNSKIFEKKIFELGKLEPKIEKLAKELGLMINLTKCRILNIDEVCKGEDSVLQCYFINSNTSSLKYFELDLNEDVEVRVRKYWNAAKEFFISENAGEEDKENFNKLNYN